MATKARAFTGLVYPDSAPDNWQEQLKESLLMWLISPLHQPDAEENFETGAMKTKKEHWHVMLHYGNTVTASFARDLFARFPWIVIPPTAEWFMVGSIRNLSRYFLHLDEDETKQHWKEKPQELLTVLNNFPLDLTRELTSADKRRMRIDTISFIRSNSITEYQELIDALIAIEDWELFDFTCTNTHMIQSYLWGSRKGGKE